jgi:hypothetical protein
MIDLTQRKKFMIEKNIYKDFKIEDKDFDAIQKRGYLNPRNFKLDTGEQVLGIECIKEKSFSTLLKYIVDLLDIHLNYYDEKKPYCPLGSVGGYRTMIPEDISKEQAVNIFKYAFKPFNL